MHVLNYSRIRAVLRVVCLLWAVMASRHNGVLMLAAWRLVDLTAWCLAVLQSSGMAIWWRGALLS